MFAALLSLLNASQHVATVANGAQSCIENHHDEGLTHLILLSTPARKGIHPIIQSHLIEPNLVCNHYPRQGCHQATVVTVSKDEKGLFILSLNSLKTLGMLDTYQLLPAAVA